MDKFSKIRNFVIFVTAIGIVGALVSFSRSVVSSARPDKKAPTEADGAGVDFERVPSALATQVPTQEENRIESQEENRIERWRTLAKSTRLTALKHDENGIRVNEAAIAVMDLSDTEGAKLNTCIAQFIQRLRVEELSRAYVSVMPDGSQEIVVPAFDRAKLLGELRSDISAATNSDVAEFMLDKITFDTRLAISGTEIRASLVKSDDGTDREVFVRSVAIPEQEGGRAVKGPNHITTTRPLVNGFSFRNRHLFEAMDRLPIRKESETAKADSNPAQVRNR